MLSHYGNQSENNNCCQNSHVKATEGIMLATEDAIKWERMEVLLTPFLHCVWYRNAQSTVGCFPELCFLQFSVAHVLVVLRKQFINNVVFPQGPALLVLIIIIIIIMPVSEKNKIIVIQLLFHAGILFLGFLFTNVRPTFLILIL